MYIVQEHGNLGQLGNKNTQNRTNPVLVRTENEFLTNIIEVSAGFKNSMALGIDGKAYAWGDNANSRLGITDKISNYAQQILKMQNLDDEELELTKIENVETGRNHSNISDKSGFLYTT